MLRDVKTMSFDRVSGAFLLNGSAGEPLKLYHMGVTDPIAEAATIDEMMEKLQELEDDLASLRYDLRYPHSCVYGIYQKNEPEEGKPDAEPV